MPFVVVTPAGRPPSGGWPLAVFGHGYGGEMLSNAFLVAGGLARQGIATVAISVVGHGGGPEGRLLVGLGDGRTLTVRVPGRGVDLDADGRIEPTEGLAPPPGSPFASLGLRDGLRQQVVDLMALVRSVKGGLDVDGDGVPDTGQGSVGYVGHSLGGIYGTLFLAVESRVRVGVLVVPGGPVSEIARLSPVFRPRLKEAFGRRVPSLLNLPGDFREDLPLRGDGPVTAPVSGALAIQEYLARIEWLGRRADPVAYARHLRRAPLPGLDPARVLVQFALGDPRRAKPHDGGARPGWAAGRPHRGGAHRPCRARGRRGVARSPRVPARRPRSGPDRPRGDAGAGAGGALPARRRRGRVDPDRPLVGRSRRPLPRGARRRAHERRCPTSTDG